MKTTQPQLSSSFIKLCRELSTDKKDSASQRQNSSSSHSEDGNRDLQAVFAYMDANRDGTISTKELQNSLKTLGEQLSDEEAEAAVKLSDTNGDGVLDFEEFAQLIKGGNECTKKKRTCELKEAFRMYTEEGEECITPRSLKMLLGKLGESRTTDECRVMIKAFDLNADGVLSFDEFSLMMG